MSDQRLDLLGSLCASVREITHFTRHNREAASLIASARLQRPR
jgi:hypothetical protein